MLGGSFLHIIFYINHNIFYLAIQDTAELFNGQESNIPVVFEVVDCSFADTIFID